MASQKNESSSISQRLSLFIGGRSFFVGVMVLLGLQALWIAFTGRYPMAFDEDFHLGLIRLYAEHPSPFWTAHPAGGDAFGALTRDASYLFHYVMSFPYRLISVFTDSTYIQVMILRIMNIGFFLCGLPLFRKLLLNINASRALAHSVLAVFVLIPIVPLLAAQINYDNVIFPLTALLLLLAVSISRRIVNGTFDATKVMQFLIVGLTASITKYAFLPIFIAAFTFLGIRVIRHNGVAAALQQIRVSIEAAFRSRTFKILLIPLVVLLVLSFERYGVNVLRYQTPVPDCAQVLTVDQCSSYGPWIRDYNLAADNSANPDPLFFTAEWFRGMWVRTFFAVDGPSTSFQTRGPFIIPAVSAALFAVVGVIALVWNRRSLLTGRRASITLLVGTSLFYVAVLFAQQFQLYVETGVPVAINGRYLIPLGPVLIGLAALAVRAWLSSIKVKVLIVAIVIACLAFGGGALTYILRSNDAWYWPGSFVQNANQTVQSVIGPITPGYNNPTQFL